MIAGLARRQRRAALAVGLDQRRDHLEGLATVAAALETEAHQIHSDQAGGLLDRLPREDGVVPDGHAVFVDALLEAPQPPRRMPQHAIGFRHLGNRDVRAPKGGAPGMEGSGELHEGLALALLAVAVLREERRARGRVRARGHNRIAHAPTILPEGVPQAIAGGTAARPWPPCREGRFRDGDFPSDRSRLASRPTLGYQPSHPGFMPARALRPSSGSQPQPSGPRQGGQLRAGSSAG